MPFGLAEGIGLVGAGANLLGGMGSAKASKELLRRQAQYADMQNQLFRSVQPQYQALLAEYAKAAGIGPGAPALNQYGLSPQEEMQLRMADEDISRRQMGQGNQLRFQLGQRGIANSSIGAALARNSLAGQLEYGRLRRGLTINAPNVHLQRLASYMQALQPAFASGGQAANIYGQQGQYMGNQSAQSFAGLENTIQQYKYGQQLKRLGAGGYGGGGGITDASQIVGDISGYPNTY